MLRDRHEIDKFFLDILALTSEMDPVLAHIDVLLDDDELYQRVRGDFARRYPKTLQTGRNSTPVEVVLRVLVVKHLYGRSYAETEKHVRDSLVLRHFCRVYAACTSSACRTRRRSCAGRTCSNLKHLSP